MLFPLMVCVGAGVALERYYLAERRIRKYLEKTGKDAEKAEKRFDDAAKNSGGTESIMDYINIAKKTHPQVVPRRKAATILMQKLAGKEDGSISQETFEKTKAVVEEYCGIRNLEYDSFGGSIRRGEINEECPETPVLDVRKLNCLTKEELILIAPKLKDLFVDIAEHTDKD